MVFTETLAPSNASGSPDGEHQGFLEIPTHQVPFTVRWPLKFTLPSSSTCSTWSRNLSLESNYHCSVFNCTSEEFLSFLVK